MKKIENYIHGKITSTSNNFIHVHDPSTGDVISEVVMSDINDLYLDKILDLFKGVIFCQLF